MQIKGEIIHSTRGIFGPRILDLGDSEPAERTAEMPQGIDDFTIVLPELADMATFGLGTYDGLDRLWRMVERYKMTDPVAITVIDHKGRCLRAFRAYRHPATGWQLEEKSPSVESPLGDEVEFPLTLNAQDSKGNILKMRLRLAMESHPNLLPK